MDELLEIATDSDEYHILSNACQKVTTLSGLTCEIGVREGGSSYKIMKTLLDAGSKRPHVAIDPYGNIEYRDWEVLVHRIDYTNNMRNKHLSILYKWAFDNEYNFLFFCLEDNEYFKRFGDGVPIYDNFKRICNEYALVFYDGPHTVADILCEVDFFASRTQLGGLWVFDDINQYPHMEKVDKYVQNFGFSILEQGKCKISYQRERLILSEIKKSIL